MSLILSLKKSIVDVSFTASSSLWLKQWTELIHRSASLNFTSKPLWIPVLMAVPFILRLASWVWRVVMLIQWKESSIQAFRPSAWACSGVLTLRNLKTGNPDEGDKNKTYIHLHVWGYWNLCYCLLRLHSNAHLKKFFDKVIFHGLSCEINKTCSSTISSITLCFFHSIFSSRTKKFSNSLNSFSFFAR